jgi:quercetin dioxygenase-like cupin family protein
MFLKNVISTAEFSAAKMGKTTLVQGSQLLAGLNCFEPGQEHALHTHAGQEKLYIVLEGTGIVRIGAQQATLGAGDAAFAAEGVEHSVRNPGPGRLVVLAVLAPPPR